ncbi:MAG: hypothetical protein JO257_21920 [Deltaproteobacteria bacterium]|nr:hypothetical protein [Deltaproteobacteria bacterium]
MQGATFLNWAWVLIGLAWLRFAVRLARSYAVTPTSEALRQQVTLDQRRDVVVGFHFPDLGLVFKHHYHQLGPGAGGGPVPLSVVLIFGGINLAIVGAGFTALFLGDHALSGIHVGDLVIDTASTGCALIAIGAVSSVISLRLVLGYVERVRALELLAAAKK